jgi:hypothetical protein
MRGYRPVTKRPPREEVDSREGLQEGLQHVHWIYWVALIELIVILSLIVGIWESKPAEYLAFNVPHGESELPIRVMRNTSTSNIYKYDLSYPDDSSILAGKVMRFLDEDGRDRFDIFAEITAETAFGEYTEQTGKMSGNAIQFRVVNLETGEEAVLLPIGLSYSIYNEDVGSLFPTFYFFSYRKYPSAKTRTSFVSLFAGVTSFYGDAEREYYEFFKVLREYMDSMFKRGRRRMQSIANEAVLGATTASIGKMMTKISKTQGGTLGYLTVQCKLKSAKTCVEDTAYVASSTIGTMFLGPFGGKVVKSAVKTAENHKSFLTNLASSVGYTAGSSAAKVVVDQVGSVAEHVVIDTLGGEELSPVIKAGSNMLASGAATYIAGNLASTASQKTAGYLDKHTKFFKDLDTKATSAFADSKISKKAVVLVDDASTDLKKGVDAVKTKAHELWSDF